MIYKMPYRGFWLEFTTDEIAAGKQMLACDSLSAKLPGRDAVKLKRFVEWFESVYHDVYQRNPLSFFLAHSGGVDFINDRTNKLCIITAGIQTGKSMSLFAKLGLKAVKTYPEWMCFTHNSLIYHKWEGAGRMMIASYEWTHIRTNIWPKLCEILPVDELREYSPKWTSPMARRKYKVVSEHSPTCKLHCGTIIDVFCYMSPPQSFTSTTYTHGVFLDEQSPKHVVEAAYDRGANCPTFQISNSCTPEQIKGCPWTGKAGWLYKAWTGADTLGMTIGRYKIDRQQIPFAIISEESRKQHYYKYIEHPRLTGNQKAIRSGESHYHGTFETGEGLVYDNWLPHVHWITPFDIPKTWTRCRAIDPGGTTAMGWGAISPWGDLILDKEYYDTTALGIADTVRKIVAMSGNRLLEVPGSRAPGADGNVHVQYEEQFCGEEYAFTVMDGRSFKHPSGETGITLGMKFAAEGLRCTPASGKKNVDAIPLVKEWLEIVPEHVHILIRMKVINPLTGKPYTEIMTPGGVPLKGAPRLYVFNTLRHFRTHIESYMNKGDLANDPAPNQDDHDMDWLKYMIQAGPRYLGPTYFGSSEQVQNEPMMFRGVIPEFKEQEKPRGLYEYH